MLEAQSTHSRGRILSLRGGKLCLTMRNGGSRVLREIHSRLASFLPVVFQEDALASRCKKDGMYLCRRNNN